MNQIGTTGLESRFNMLNAATEALALPHLTNAQLSRLPLVTQQLAKVPSVAALAAKHLAMAPYRHDLSIPFSERQEMYRKMFHGGIQKQEFMAATLDGAKNSIDNNGLRIKTETFTATMAKTCLDKGEAVIYSTGEQLSKTSKILAKVAGGMHSRHDLLIGQLGLFSDNFNKPVEIMTTEKLLTFPIHPTSNRYVDEPRDWERIFEFGLKYREKDLVAKGYLPPLTPGKTSESSGIPRRSGLEVDRRALNAFRPLSTLKQTRRWK